MHFCLHDSQIFLFICVYSTGALMAAEEDSIEQAAAARRERLRALKAAQELLNTPDEDSAQVEHKTNDENGTNEEK